MGVMVFLVLRPQGLAWAAAEVLYPALWDSTERGRRALGTSVTWRRERGATPPLQAA